MNAVFPFNRDGDIEAVAANGLGRAEHASLAVQSLQHALSEIRFSIDMQNAPRGRERLRRDPASIERGCQGYETVEGNAGEADRIVRFAAVFTKVRRMAFGSTAVIEAQFIANADRR